MVKNLNESDLFIYNYSMKANIITGLVFQVIACVLFTLSIFNVSLRMVFVAIGTLLLLLGTLIQTVGQRK